MAKSKIGGAFGFLRGSAGSVTYSTQRGSNGKREQIVKQKVTEVANPQTAGQVMQRCKIAPAQRFLKALDNILDHSFEGKVYGTPSKQYFISLALRENGPYIPKGITQVYPYAYQISEGSLQGVSVVAEKTADAVTFTTNATAAALVTMAGRQLTSIRFTIENGIYTPNIARIVLAKTADEIVAQLGEASLKESAAGQAIVFDGDNVAAAIIMSAQDASGNWLRSDSRLVLDPDLMDSLTNADAINLTLASYQDSADLNKINSQWYLNMGSAQAFNGKVISIENLAFTNVPSGSSDEVGETVPVEVIGGQMLVNGRVVQILFTSNGQADGTLYGINGRPVEFTPDEDGEPGAIKASDTNYATLGYQLAVYKDTYPGQLGN